MSHLTSLSLIEAREMLKNGDISAEQLTAACLSRIERTEPDIRALLHHNKVDALTGARDMDKARARDDFDARPLWGIPVAVKDCITVKGAPCTAASRILEGFMPPYDAHVVQKLKDAGAIIIGKSNMDEFAMGSGTEHSAFQATRNPWDLTRVPGGSSGGSAASVAACQCFAALGTDTGGSIRQPASLCGCVGLKPTYGRVSRYGVMAYASSFDQVGAFARSVEDAAVMLQVIAGPDERDSTCAAAAVPDYLAAVRAGNGLKGKRLGLPREYMANAALDPKVARLCRNAVDTARQLGAEIVDVSLPHADYSIAVYYILTTAEASSNLARYDGVRYGHRAKDVRDLDDLYTRSRTEGFGPEVQRRIILGTYVLSAGYYDAYYRKAAQIRRLISRDFDQALARCDMILAPVSPITAWPSGSVTDPLQLYQMDVYTLSLNLAGLPGLCFPVGLADGLPVGMQLMGKAFAEADLLAGGDALVKALGTDKQRAPF